MTRNSLPQPASGVPTFDRAATVAAFLLGGIGTGNISVGSRGELRDWEIFNWPGKGNYMPFSFFALRTEANARVVSRVLESRIMPQNRVLSWLSPLCKWTFELAYGVDLEELNMSKFGPMIGSRHVLLVDASGTHADPSDPHMIESITPRSGLPGPASGPNADPMNGHEWDPSMASPTPNADLQYACVFPLNLPKMCGEGTDCDCYVPPGGDSAAAKNPPSSALRMRCGKCVATMAAPTDP